MSYNYKALPAVNVNIPATPPPTDIQNNQARSYVIRLIPDVSAAAFRTKQIKELVLWYRLRSINRTGSGVLFKEYAIPQLLELYNYNLKTLYRHLMLGNGKFWNLTTDKLGRSRIMLFGVSMVSGYLETMLDGDRHYRDIKSTEFDSTVKARSQVYASIHHPDTIKGNPVSRARISEYTGLGKTSQRRYEKIAKVRHHPNFVREYDEKYKVNLPVIVPVNGKSKVYHVNKRLPNTYHTQQEPASKGMLRRVSKELRSCLTGEATKSIKRYFSGAKALVKSLNAQGKGWHKGYYRLGTSKRRIKGRQEWIEYAVFA